MPDLSKKNFYAKLTKLLTVWVMKNTMFTCCRYLYQGRQLPRRLQRDNIWTVIGRSLQVCKCSQGKRWVLAVRYFNLPLGRSRKYPCLPHRGNWKLTLLPLLDVLIHLNTIIINNFFCPPPLDGRSFLCGGMSRWDMVVICQYLALYVHLINTCTIWGLCFEHV